MSDIITKIQDFFTKDEHLPHHFFTVESTTLTPALLRESMHDVNMSYIFDRHYDSFGVNDARTLIDLQNEKTEQLSLYIISFTTITVEAQNALLKALEEPKPNKIFFFIVSSAKNMLPALQSRTYVLCDYEDREVIEHSIDVHEFIDASLEKRFDIIKSVTDKKSKDAQILSKTDVIHFLNNLELYFYEHKNTTMLRKILAARKYLGAKGASRKMILEDIAMTIELIK